MKHYLRLLFWLGALGAAPLSVCAQNWQDQDPFPLNDSLIEMYIQRAQEFAPALERYRARERQAEFEVKLKQREWLDQLRLGAQFNALNNQFGGVDQGLVFAPNFGLNFSLSVGSIANRKLKKKVALEELSVAEANKDEYETFLRQEVTSRLYAYQKWLRMLQLHRNVVENSKLMMKFVEEQFKESEISYFEYGQYYRSYMDNRERLINTQNEVQAKKAALLELIGEL